MSRDSPGDPRGRLRQPAAAHPAARAVDWQLGGGGSEPTIPLPPAARRAGLRRRHPLRGYALARWVKLAKVRPGEPLFRRVTNTGTVGDDRLTDGSVARIVKNRLARHLLDAGRSPAEAAALVEAFSGHSLRAGYATTAGENEVADHRVQQRMRHKSMDTTSGYIRSGRQWSKSGLRAIGPDGRERSSACDRPRLCETHGVCKRSHQSTHLCEAQTNNRTYRRRSPASP